MADRTSGSSAVLCGCGMGVSSTKHASWCPLFVSTSSRASRTVPTDTTEHDHEPPPSHAALQERCCVRWPHPLSEEHGVSGLRWPVSEPAPPVMCPNYGETWHENNVRAGLSNCDMRHQSEPAPQPEPVFAADLCGESVRLVEYGTCANPKPCPMHADVQPLGMTVTTTQPEPERCKQCGEPWGSCEHFTYCDDCDGCGWNEGGQTLQTKCERCDGQGVIPEPTPQPDPVTRTCSKCYGSGGGFPPNECSYCNGSGDEPDFAHHIPIARRAKDNR